MTTLTVGWAGRDRTASAYIALVTIFVEIKFKMQAFVVEKRV